ncbi:MAG: T9SS type A sorting domain-containing protein, partial [Flavobacteriia bacterium]
ELNVYPNPATENATVTWNGEEVQKVVLMTITGQKIQTIEAVNLQKVELTGVAQGEYFVKLYTVNGQELVRKVIFI